MNDDLQALQHGIQLALNGLVTADERRELYRAILGRQGLLVALMAPMGRLSPEDRKARGAGLNRFKTEVEALFEAADAS